MNGVNGFSFKKKLFCAFATEWWVEIFAMNHRKQSTLKLIPKHSMYR